MKHTLSFLFILLCGEVTAQIQHPALLSIEGIGGNDYDFVSPRVVTTQDGGFIISINTRSSTGNTNTDCTSTQYRHVFNKYSADGTMLLWQKCIPYNNDSSYRYLFPTPDGNFILGGAFYSTGTGQEFLIRKETATGNIIWWKRYGGSGGQLLRDMAATDDGGYIMLGTSNYGDGDVGLHYGDPFSNDIWALKLDSNGNKVWSSVLGGSSNEEAYCVVPVPGGGCYILGNTYSADFDCIGNHGMSDAFIARLDDTGGKVWSRCLGGSNQDGLWKGWAVQDGKGGVLITTDTYSGDGDVSGHIANGDFWLIAVDSSNNIIWDKCFGGTNGETSNTLCKATDGSLWMGGISGSLDGHVGVAYGLGDAYLIHTDSAGNFLSSKVLGTIERDETFFVHALLDGKVMIGGTYGTPGAIGGEFPTNHNGLTDVFLARFAPWTTGVAAINKEDNILQVYPNPATNEITIRIKDSYRLSIRIINSAGDTVYRKDNIKGDVKTDVSGWSRGMHYLQATDKKGNQFFTKFLIN